MEKQILSVVDYEWDKQFYCPKGKSQTVPNEATSLKDLVHRAMIGANLPEIAKSLEYGEDEDFDDAFEPGQDLSDYSENLEYIERYANTIKAAKEAEKAKKKAVEASKEPEGIPDPLEPKEV